MAPLLVVLRLGLAAGVRAQEATSTSVPAYDLFGTTLRVANVPEQLGRCKPWQRRVVDTPAGCRNGYGKPRQLAVRSGTVIARRSRVRGVEGWFADRVPPLFVGPTQQVSDMLPELDLYGLV
jgi:hypothetical protein